MPSRMHGICNNYFIPALAVRGPSKAQLSSSNLSRQHSLQFSVSLKYISGVWLVYQWGVVSIPVGCG